MTPFESAPSQSHPLRDALTRALAALDRGEVDDAVAAVRTALDAHNPPPPSKPDVDIVLSRDGTWYECAGRRVDLLRRGNLRRILLALVDASQSAPGRALSRDEVQSAGWPSERMRPESGAMRVHTAICRLRKTGLGPFLVTRDDGYLIDPRARVRRCDPASP